LPSEVPTSLAMSNGIPSVEPWTHYSTFVHAAQSGISPPATHTTTQSDPTQWPRFANAIDLNIVSLHSNAGTHGPISENGEFHAPSAQFPPPDYGQTLALALNRNIVEMTEDEMKAFYKTAFNRGVDFGFELGHKICFKKYYSDTSGTGTPMRPQGSAPSANEPII